PPARGAVQAKTGTTSIASALSGYVRRRYVFSVLQNGHPISYWWARRAQDRHAGLLRLRELRAGVLAGDHARRLLRDRVTDLRAERFQRAFCLLTAVL